MTVEADAFPEVSISSPPGEVEVAGDARVPVEWTASDDFGLSDLTLVLKAPGGEEERRVLRSLAPARRDAGTFDLDLAPLRLAEGERLLYWLEVKDNDTVSGPKRAASPTRAVKIYSEAEHHQRVLAEARRHWEEMVRILGDRMEQLPRGQPADAVRVQKGLALDGRTRQLHERLREAAQAMRKDKAAPRELPAALLNAAQGIREREVLATAARQTLARQMQFGKPGDVLGTRRVDDLDDALDRELEKDVLYLEQLFDKRRAEDLVRMAKDLASRRRELASLLEKYKQAPSEQAKKQLLAEVARLRARMQDMLHQMAELARGVSDSHMNAEAMAEMAKGKDVAGGMKRVEEMLARDDVDAALKELDAMGSALEDMMSSLAAHRRRPRRAHRRPLPAAPRVPEGPRVGRAGAGEGGGRDREGAQRVPQGGAGAAQAGRAGAAQGRRARPEGRGRAPPVARRDLAALRGRLRPVPRPARRPAQGALVPGPGRRPRGLAGGPCRRCSGSPSGSTTRRPCRSASPSCRSATRPSSGRPPSTPGTPCRRRARPARSWRSSSPTPAPCCRRGSSRSSTGWPGSSRPSRGRPAGCSRSSTSCRRRRRSSRPRPAASWPRGAATCRRRRARSARGTRSAASASSRRRSARSGGCARGSRRWGRGAARAAGASRSRTPPPGRRSTTGMEGDPSREKVEIPQVDASKTREQFRRDLLEAMKQGTPEPYQGEVKRYYEELVK